MNTLPPPHVLLTDDDPDIGDMVSEYFGRHAVRVTVVSSGRRMFEVLDREAVDLVLLDLRLPGEDGLQIASSLRQRASLPIVLLTGRTAEGDRVKGLELGADDYVTKPFSPRELLARVRAVMRRYQVQSTLPERDTLRRAFRFAGWELNLRNRSLLSPQGASVELSNTEFNLLAALCHAPQVVLTRAQLLSMSRLHEAEVYDRAIDVQIRRLRMKLDSVQGGQNLIVTERGVGYRFACAVETLY